jgi:hypothetical protein
MLLPSFLCVAVAFAYYNNSNNNNNNVGKCLLSFGAESFVFQVAIQKIKD